MIAHIIHNPARTDRMQNLLEQTADQRIQYQLWPAVNHEDPRIGCTKAHKNIVRFARDNNFPKVWIMEDDCIFTAPGAAQYFLNSYPITQPHIYTAGIFGIHKFHERNSVFDYMKSFSATHCYIVHQSYYDRFLALPENDNIDALISNDIGAMHGGIILCKPLCTLQMPSYSDILKKEVNYNTEQWLWQHELFGTTLNEFNKKWNQSL